MQMTVELLILGAGWTSTFLGQLCDEQGITYAATSRSGRESTVKFVFDPESDDLTPYTILPNARTILITFPIDKKGGSERLLQLYSQTRSNQNLETRFIQLGSTSIWDGGRLKRDVPIQNKWYDRHSPFVATPRAEAEVELLALSPKFPTTVLNLAGLWGGTRSPKNWVARVAPSKEALKDKGSVHLIHGGDIARVVLAAHHSFDKFRGQRWILTDGRVYDWWDLASAWGTPALEGETQSDRGPQMAWVRELMMENGVRALPRNVDILGRALDSRELWNTIQISPLYGRLEEIPQNLRSSIDFEAPEAGELSNVASVAGETGNICSTVSVGC